MFLRDLIVLLRGIVVWIAVGFFCECACMLAGNEIGAQGAGRLAEPLGKLTALQKLNLSGTV